MAEFKDTVSLTVNNRNNVESELRNIPGIAGLKWSFHVYPFGLANTSQFIEAYVRVTGGDVLVNATMKGFDSAYRTNSTKTFNHEIMDGNMQGCLDLYSNANIRNGYGINCTITCDVTFKLKEVKIVPLMLHELIDESKAHCTDAKINVDKTDIKVHRGFLSMISPVFNAMFSPDTKESKTGTINITDFTVATVKNALNYCYGTDLGKKTAAEVIDMLRFYDKYDIQPAITKLEAWLKASLTTKNFAPIAAYAWQFSRTSLQADCGRMFHRNVKDLACHPDFVVLDPIVIAGVAQAGLVSTGAKIPATSTAGQPSKAPAVDLTSRQHRKRK
uniref:BTB domain-containing protein n=1 Tax=Panagrellus redivivus TaxID=6233 RepID=A0A7E4W5Y8_PANRE